MARIWIRNISIYWLRTFLVVFISAMVLVVLFDHGAPCFQPLFGATVCSPPELVFFYFLVAAVLPLVAIVTSIIATTAFALQYFPRNRVYLFLRSLRQFSNIAGGMVTIASVAFPWYVVGTYETPTSWFYVWDRSTGPNSMSILIILLIIVGGICSFISRIGAVSSLLGCALYDQANSGLLSLPTGMWVAFAFGFFLAIEGAVLSLLGLQWNTSLVKTIRLGLGFKRRTGPL